MASYEIKFTDSGIDAVTRKIRDASKASKEFNQSLKDGRQESARTAQEATSQATKTLSARSYRPTGIYSRLTYESDKLSQIKASGYGGTALKDQEYRVKQAQKAVDRADRPSEANAAIDRFASAKFLPGGQSLKSVGLDSSKLAEYAPFVADLAEIALPLIAGAAVVAGIGAIGVGLANSAAGTSRDVTGASIYGGGTPHESEQLTALGKFLGISGGGAGQLAESFGNALQGGGYGSGFFRSKGISDQGIYTIDKSRNLLAAVDILRDIRSDQQAILVARTTGITELLRFRNLSPDTYQSLRSSMEGAASPEATKENAEFDAQVTILGNEWDRFKQKVGTPIAGFLASNLKGLNDLVGGSQGTGNGSQDKQKAASDDLVGALHGVTRALDDSSSGGGRQFKNAVPKAWTYGQIQEAMLRGTASDLGNFSV